jgi:hypothetical protein
LNDGCARKEKQSSFINMPRKKKGLAKKKKEEADAYYDTVVMGNAKEKEREELLKEICSGPELHADEVLIKRFSDICPRYKGPFADIKAFTEERPEDDCAEEMRKILQKEIHPRNPKKNGKMRNMILAYRNCDTGTTCRYKVIRRTTGMISCDRIATHKAMMIPDIKANRELIKEEIADYHWKRARFSRHWELGAAYFEKIYLCELHGRPENLRTCFKNYKLGKFGRIQIIDL